VTVGPGHRILDGASRARPDARHLRDLVDLGLAELLQRAEVLDQGPPAYLAETGYVVEQALDHRLRPAGPVVGDREAVSLVADPLEEIEALRGPRHDHGVLLVGQPDLLEPLGQPADRDVDDAQLTHRRLRCGHLGWPAVDHDEARCVGELARPAGLGVDQHRAGVGGDLGGAGLLVEEPPEPAADDLVHRRHVVLTVDRLDHEAAVLALPGQAVLEDDHAGDHLGALEVGDVVALDAQRCHVETERLLDLLQRLVAGGQVGAALGLVEHQGLGGVAGDGLLQRPLVATLWHPDPDPAAPALGKQRLEGVGVGREGTTSWSSAPA